MPEWTVYTQVAMVKVTFSTELLTWLSVYLTDMRWWYCSAAVTTKWRDASFTSSHIAHQPARINFSEIFLCHNFQYTGGKVKVFAYCRSVVNLCMFVWVVYLCRYWLILHLLTRYGPRQPLLCVLNVVFVLVQPSRSRCSCGQDFPIRGLG